MPVDLLAQLMANRASDGRMTRLMTIDARLHFHRQDLYDWVLLPYVAMADAARDSFADMPAMAEEHKVGQAVHGRGRQDDLILRNSTMARQAGLAGWKACAIAR